jgi:prevent-host-death family protein
MAVSITATEANQFFSRLLREVQDGQEFVVTSRGRAVARVIPYSEPPQAEKLVAMIDALARRPRRSLPGWTRDDLYP